MITQIVKAILKSFILLVIVFIGAVYIAVFFFKPAYTEVGGINAKRESVNLRRAPTVKSPVVAKLRSGEFARLLSDTAKWNHFYKVSHDQTILKRDFELGYSRIFKLYVLRSEALNQYEGTILKYSPWAVLGLLALFFILLMSNFIRFVARRKKDPKFPIFQNDVVARDHLAVERNKLVRELEEKVKEQTRLLELSHDTDVASREKAYNNLKHQYDEAVGRAKSLGVDLEGSNIDSLVKGRLFELFAAKIWRKNDREVTIEDWTSDKGANHNIYVKSDGNPDFLLSFAGKKVAVECKYRGKPYFSLNGEKEHCLPLDRKKVIARYYRYKKEKDIEVFLLFGMEGTAENPESLYLLRVGDCYNVKFDYKYESSPRFGATLSDLEEYRIAKHELIERVKAGIL